jgi:hypothetical protein
MYIQKNSSNILGSDETSQPDKCDELNNNLFTLSASNYFPNLPNVNHRNLSFFVLFNEAFGIELIWCQTVR